MSSAMSGPSNRKTSTHHGLMLRPPAEVGRRPQGTAPAGRPDGADLVDLAPWPQVVAVGGAASHCTPTWTAADPGRFGSIPSGPPPVPARDLEGAAFHEAIPGHHLQLSRLQLLTKLPASTDG